MKRLVGDLERTLRAILPTEDLPDSMPVDLAQECQHLPGVVVLLEDVDRGSVLANRTSYGLSYARRARVAIEEYREAQPTRRLVAVGCSASKREDGPVPARDLYRGAYWTCKRRYAETAADWRIISAKYGLLHPDVEVAPYERTVEDLRAVPIQSDERLPTGDPVDTLLDQWAHDLHEHLREWVYAAAGTGPAPVDVHLSVILGRRYHDPLADRGVFAVEDAAPSSVVVDHPFQAEDFAGNGEQMAWLTDRAEALGGASA